MEYSPYNFAATFQRMRTLMWLCFMEVSKYDTIFILYHVIFKYLNCRF